MKIFVVNNFYHPYSVGGAEESLKLQLEALALQGADVTVFTVAHDGSLRSACINGVKVRYVKTTFRRGSPLNKHRSWWLRLGWQFGDFFRLGVLARFWLACRAAAPDCVYVNNVAGMSRALAVAARILQIPVLIALRDYSWSCLRQSHFRRGKNCANRCFVCNVGGGSRRLIASMASGVVANSKVILDKHREYGLFRNVPASVVYAGAPRGRLSESNGAERLRIGFIGQINATKGVDEFLSEVAPLASGRDLIVVIAGSLDGEYAKSLEIKWRGHSWVQFVGYMKREQFYSAVDVVIIPSLWMEPLSRVTYEAMASAKCVIASSRGGQREIINHGVDGYVYNPGTHELRQLLSVLLDNRKKVEEIGEAAYDRSSFFSPNHAAEGLDRAIRQLRDIG